ncbi:hypothetical protein K6327_004444, partial [Vibrio vulnificus]|nr:hypothetical protein [Vibrio vulnificus]
LQRIIYTLTNETSGDVKMGVINVTASESGAANTPPTTPDVVGTAGSNQEITLSPNITDADGDTVQLISVMSPQGGVVKSLVQDGPINDAYFTNKNFTFQGVAAGLYTVYYTAHDHNGGYNTGKANITVTGAMGLTARDASFYRDVSSLAYDFTVDLRSYVTSSNPDNVTYLGAEYASDSADKTPANLVMSSNNKILTYKVPANQSGVVKIKYTVKDGSAQTSGTIFISFGAALPTITTLGTTPRVDIGATVAATSTCGNGCVQAKTTYEWVFNGRPLSSENDITVPEGYSGESLTLIATPYNAAGQRGVSKSVTYNYPFRAATVSVNKEKAKIGESITMTVNTTYLGQPDASAPIKVTPVSATNRQNQSETPTAKVNGSDSATVNTNAAGNATFTLTDPNGKGVKTTFEATIGGHEYGSEQATFTTLTSPDVSTANFWGHMPNSITVGERQFYRTPLASEETGAAGMTHVSNGERWGRLTQAEARTYCNNNLPESSVMEDLYAAYPNGNLHRTLGWPTGIFYGTNTGDSVIHMDTGVVSSQAGYNTFVSCSRLLPIDSTGVTIDILKEDGTYTNDKFPPSSTAMTYGALMFPGAGIRINLSDAVIPSTITASAPTGYVKNIVGKSVELTDMVRDDYRDQTVIVTGENASGDLLGLRLKVSSSKYRDIVDRKHIPRETHNGVLQLDRGIAYPGAQSLYQHGMTISKRVKNYEGIVGASERVAALRKVFTEREVRYTSSPTWTRYLLLVAAQNNIQRERIVTKFREVLGVEAVPGYIREVKTLYRTVGEWTGWRTMGSPGARIYALEIRLSARRPTDIVFNGFTDYCGSRRNPFLDHDTILPGPDDGVADMNEYTWDFGSDGVASAPYVAASLAASIYESATTNEKLEQLAQNTGTGADYLYSYAPQIMMGYLEGDKIFYRMNGHTIGPVYINASNIRWFLEGQWPYANYTHNPLVNGTAFDPETIDPPDWVCSAMDHTGIPTETHDKPVSYDGTVVGYLKAAPDGALTEPVGFEK